MMRLILATAVLFGAVQVQTRAIACSFDVCGRECPMHAEKKAEPVSCCDKEQPLKPAECKCSISSDERSEAVVSKAHQPVQTTFAIVVASIVALYEQPIREE